MFRGTLFQKALDLEALEARGADGRVPIQACVVKKTLNFNDQMGFEVTANAKVVEAHFHPGIGVKEQDGENLTVIFHGVASFTFRITPAKRINQRTVFRGFYGKRRITANLSFAEDGSSFEATGMTAGDGKEFSLHASVKKRSGLESVWIGFYKKDGAYQPMDFSKFVIQEDGTISCDGADDEGDWKISGKINVEEQSELGEHTAEFRKVYSSGKTVTFTGVCNN